MGVRLPARAGPGPGAAAACAGAPAARVMDSFMREPPMSLAPQASSRAARSGPIFTQDACARAGRAARPGRGLWRTALGQTPGQPRFPPATSQPQLVELGVGARMAAGQHMSVVRHGGRHAVSTGLAPVYEATRASRRVNAATSSRSCMPAGHTAGQRDCAAQARLDVADVGQRQARHSVHEYALAQRRAPPCAPCCQGPKLSAVMAQSSCASASACLQRLCDSTSADQPPLAALRAGARGSRAGRRAGARRAGKWAPPCARTAAAQTR